LTVEATQAQLGVPPVETGAKFRMMGGTPQSKEESKPPRIILFGVADQDIVRKEIVVKDPPRMEITETWQDHLTHH
jgi:hypothetical protein